MVELGNLTDEQTPLLRDLERAAPALNETFTRLGPFAEASRPAFRSLGASSKKGTRAIRASSDEVDELRQLAAEAPRMGKPLRQLLQTADDRSRGRPDTRARRERAARRRPDFAQRTPSGPRSRCSSRSGTTSTGRRWRSTSSTRSATYLRVLLIVGSECAPYANADDGEGQGAPRALQLLARPVPAGRDASGPDRGRRRRHARPAQAAAWRAARRRRSRGRRRAGRARPSKPQVDAAAWPAGGARTRAPPEGGAPAEPSPARSAQPAPDQLLDFLLAP